jgi:hypothetical protein
MLGVTSASLGASKQEKENHDPYHSFIEVK